jgi:exodeoxyribonuclease VII large subunit
VLDRGYSLTQTATGEVVRDTAQLKKGEVIRTRLAKGTVLSEVKEKEA